MVLREARQLSVGDRLMLRLSGWVPLVWTVTGRRSVHPDHGERIVLSLVSQGGETYHGATLRPDDLVEIVP
jgi:hypothetical protein